jgi:ribonuclease HI
MAAKKYYVVWTGRQPGIYTTWSEAERQVKGFPQARYKSFTSPVAAQEAYAGGSGSTSKLATKKPAGSEQKKSTAKSSSSADILNADVVIFCDGACDPNPGKSGTGIAVYKHKICAELWYGLYNPSGTNNTAELLGLFHSLLMAKEAVLRDESVIIHCDSKYSIDCVTKWAFSWKAKDWTKKGGDIKNLDIIKSAHEIFLEIADKISVQHIKAHAGIEGNELADRMSVVAIDRREKDLSLFTDKESIPALLALDRG